MLFESEEFGRGHKALPPDPAADILHTSFENCVFRGTSFRGCHFGDCTFTECDFLRDNLDSACTFADCAIAKCQFDRCEFEPAHEGGEPLFAKVRWLACTQWRCTGLEGLF